MPRRPLDGSSSAARFEQLSLAAATGWSLFAACYALADQPQAAALSASAGAFTMAARAWGRVDPRRFDRAGHIYLAVTTLGLVGGAILEGSSRGFALWCMAAVPALAAHQLGRRAAAGWTAGVSLLIVALYASPLVALEPVGGFVWALPIAQILFSSLALALAAITRRDLDQQIALLHDRNRVIHEQAQQLQRQTIALKRARDSAVDGMRAREEFMAMVSHELRTPLSGVLGMAQVLNDTGLTAEQRDIVRAVQRSGESLLTLINDILDLSRLEADGVELEPLDFALRECVEDVLDLFAREAHEKGLELAIQATPDAPEQIRMDATRLRQILVNLVGNAVKFTHAGHVRVRIAVDQPGWLEFLVEDTGIGIAPERLDALFRPFTQGEASTTRRYGGTGLGLAISKRLVEVMGGAIDVESAPGDGSSFRFQLPAEALPDPDPLTSSALTGRTALLLVPPGARRDALVGLLLRWGVRAEISPDALDDADVLIAAGDALPTRALRPELPSLRLRSVYAAGPARPDDVLLPVRQRQLHEVLQRALDAAPRRPTPEPATGPVTAPMAERLPRTILLAEDDPINRRVAIVLLRRLGYAPDEVTDGEAALAALRDRRYDVAILDVNMPGLDGLTLARRVRAELAPAHQPWLIACTAGVDPERQQACTEAGLDDFLSKPLRSGALIAALERSGEGFFSLDASLEELSLDGSNSALAQLRLLCAGHPEEYTSMIQDYLGNAERLLESIRAARDRGDATALRRAAHNLQGVSGLFGAELVQVRSATVEDASERGAEAIDRAIADLVEALEASDTALRAEMEQARRIGI